MYRVKTVDGMGRVQVMRFLDKGVAEKLISVLKECYGFRTLRIIDEDENIIKEFNYIGPEQKGVWKER